MDLDWNRPYIIIGVAKDRELAILCNHQSEQIDLAVTQGFDWHTSVFLETLDTYGLHIDDCHDEDALEALKCGESVEVFVMPSGEAVFSDSACGVTARDGSLLALVEGCRYAAVFPLLAAMEFSADSPDSAHPTWIATELSAQGVASEQIERLRQRVAIECSFHAASNKQNTATLH